MSLGKLTLQTEWLGLARDHVLTANSHLLWEVNHRRDLLVIREGGGRF